MNEMQNKSLKKVLQEIRTPLNEIFGLASLAKKNADGNIAIKSCLSGIEKSCGELMDLLDDFLKNTLTESDNDGIEETECDISDIVTGGHEYLQPQEDQPVPQITQDISERVRGKKILIVEDNELNREIETKIFKAWGFVTDTANDGSIALEKVRNSQPGDYDIILMDIQMPVMGGWQSAKEIRKLDDKRLANIPIIGLSANVFESDAQTSAECGMNAYMKKPIDVPLLLKTIDELTN